MVFLFFIVGFLTTANAQFQVPLQTAFLSGAGGLKNTLATLISFSWFLAYPIFGRVGSQFINRYSYKGTLVRGMVLMIAGIFCFFVSSWFTVTYPDAVLEMGDNRIPAGFFIFLFGSFVVGGSATVLQVVINPYLTACYVRGTQPVQRLAIGGTSNSIGTTIAPYFVSGIVFGGLSVEDVQVSQLMLPFFALMIVLMLTALILLRLHLPDLKETRTGKYEKLERSVWSFRHLTLGVVAIFFYVGCEVCVGANINMYVHGDLGGDTSTVTLMATLYWGGLLIGRLLASTFSKISPRTQLTFTTLAASILVILAMITGNPWVLVAVGLCHSIMWGCIFTLATTDLGKYTSVASGVFMIGVIGGAIIPLLQGFFADMMGEWRWSWSIVLLGELCMLYYARIGSRIKDDYK
jgi:FHS family L-fucose permease-like MFS transporter